MFQGRVVVSSQWGVHIPARGVGAPVRKEAPVLGIDRGLLRACRDSVLDLVVSGQIGLFPDEQGLA